MRVILCDDDASERSKYSEFVRDIAEKENIDIDLIIYENAKQLLFNIEGQLDLADVLLLDINMPGISGIEAANKLRDDGYKGEIVFLTVSKEHMLEAFDIRAFNYIIKGETSKEKTAKVLKLVFETVKEKSREYIRLTGIGEYKNIALNSIKYFEVNAKIITVHYNDKKFEFISTIGKLENLLFNKGFIRIHRSYMVALSEVKSFNFKEVTLRGDIILPVGRTYYVTLKDSLNKQVDV